MSLEPCVTKPGANMIVPYLPALVSDRNPLGGVCSTCPLLTTLVYLRT